MEADLLQRAIEKHDKRLTKEVSLLRKAGGLVRTSTRPTV